MPCCATLPPLITKILSAFRTVLRRCAMTRVVRLCSAIRRSMAACRFQGSEFRAWGRGSGVGGRELGVGGRGSGNTFGPCD